MSSTLYTMGTALDRAAQHGFGVDLLVDGHWVGGRVAANDGVGVVLEGGDGVHAVVKTDRISAVRVHAELPFRDEIADGPFEDLRHGYDDGFPSRATYPMPAPRFAVAR